MRSADPLPKEIKIPVPRAALIRFRNREFFIFPDMKFVRTLIPTALLSAALAVSAQAQDLCPHKLIDRDMIVNMEGWFINPQHSRARIDIEWRHHEEAQRDTFFIHLPNTPSFTRERTMRPKSAVSYRPHWVSTSRASGPNSSSA